TTDIPLARTMTLSFPGNRRAPARCYSEGCTMTSSVASPGNSLPADRFYRTALFFLVLSGVLALAATGKLDAVSSVAAPLAILYKGIRWWRGHPAELRQSTATRFVLAYILVV